MFNYLFFRIDKKRIPAFVSMSESAFSHLMLFQMFSGAKIGFIFLTGNFLWLKKIKTPFRVSCCCCRP